MKENRKYIESFTACKKNVTYRTLITYEIRIFGQLFQLTRGKSYPKNIPKNLVSAGLLSGIW